MEDKFDIDKLDEFFLKQSHGNVYSSVIGNIEKILIEKALERSFGNQVIAAKILGLNRNTLRAKIKKYNIDTQRYKL